MDELNEDTESNHSMFYAVTMEVSWPRLLTADYNGEDGVQRVAMNR